MKFIKPPCYNESGLALGQMSCFFQKHDAVFHASINVSLGRQRSLTGGLQAVESQAAGGTKQCAAHGLTSVPAGCARQGSPASQGWPQPEGEEGTGVPSRDEPVKAP